MKIHTYQRNNKIRDELINKLINILKYKPIIKNRQKSILLGMVGLISVIGAVPSINASNIGKIIVNGEIVPFNQTVGEPMTIEGRIYVPIRIMADVLGYSTNWDQVTQTVVVTDKITTISIKINSPIATVNGSSTYIDEREGEAVLTTTASLQEGKIYIPLRFITEQLGCEVNFNNGITYITNKLELGAQPITPKVYQQMLGRGMDVDWSKTEKGRTYYNEEAAKDFKEVGISHVRIRIKDPADESLLNSLDKQIEDCLEVGLIPIIAYQADEFKNEPNEKNIQKVVHWWSTVAKRYKDVSHLLSFDLLIEATDALNKQPEKLNEIYERLVTEIRKTNPTRIIMISPRLRSDAAYLNELKIPTNHNGYLMAEWHFYASGPSKTNERKLWTTGTKKEKQLIQEKINLALKWQRETGIPTWVGAWMPGNYNDGDDYSIEEQVIFAQYMTQALDEASIPFAVNSDTKFYNRETNRWIDEMIPVRQCIFNK